MTVLNVLCRDMTEKALQEQVRRLATQLSWLHYHTHNSMHSAKGFPDCVLVKDGRLIFAELKRENGKITREQGVWLLELSGIDNVEAYVVRPSSFAVFAKVLAGIASAEEIWALSQAVREA